MRTDGYLIVEAHSAFDAVCRAYSCLIDLGEFAIERISPAMAQCWRKGRYDYTALEFVGEWRVPCRVRTDDAGTIPDEARRMLEHVGSFLDFRVYPDGDTPYSGERGESDAGQQPKYRLFVESGSAGIEQSGVEDSAVLAGSGE